MSLYIGQILPVLSCGKQNQGIDQIRSYLPGTTMPVLLLAFGFIKLQDVLSPVLSSVLSPGPSVPTCERGQCPRQGSGVTQCIMTTD